MLTPSSLRPAVVLLVAPLGLIAQTPTAPGVIQLEAVEVTAQKRVQAVQDVPIAITAYSGAFLESAGIERYKDLAPLVPGVFIQEQSPNNPGINIRGVTSDSTDPRAEMRVSIFQDGVSINRATGSVTELFDLERIEVLKGPQGTLFGRGAEVGAISIIQRKPTAATESGLTTGFGNYGAFTASGFANSPIGGGTFLGRFAFSYSQRDGIVDNLADGSDLNGRDTLALRPSLRWLPSERTTVDLIFNYQRDNPPGTAFKSGVIPTRNGDTDPFLAADLNRGRDLSIDRTVWGGTAIVAHEINDAWSLTATTGVREYDSIEQFDADGSRLYLLELADDSQGKHFSQEVRLNFDTGGRFTGFVGASYVSEDSTQRVPLYTDERQVWPFLSGEFRNGLLAAGLPAAFVNTAVPAMNPFVAQDRLPATFAAFAAIPSLSSLALLANAPLKAYHTEEYINSADKQTTDLFADGTYAITDRFELTAGVRVSFEEQTSGYEARRAPVASTLGFLLGAAPNFAFVPTNGNREASLSDTSWVGRLIGRYEVSPQFSVYAGVARGRLPAAIIIDSTTVTQADEEIIWNYEVGIKGGTKDRRYDYSASVFRYDYSNFQTAVRDPNNAARFIVVSAGNATGLGAEAAVRGRLNDIVSLFSTYGYTDATFDDTDDNGQPQRYAGSSFRLTAEHTFAFGTTLSWSSAANGTFTLTPVYQYKSEHFFDDDNTRFGGTLRQDGYGVVNLQAGWRSKTGRWEISAFADNLFDKDYLVDAGNFGANYGIPTFIRGEPLLFGGSASVKF
ncbi:MAG TPA: TonB-dependent receptor [Opitutaceae bacterium]